MPTLYEYLCKQLGTIHTQNKSCITVRLGCWHLLHPRKMLEISATAPSGAISGFHTRTQGKSDAESPELLENFSPKCCRSARPRRRGVKKRNRDQIAHAFIVLIAGKAACCRMTPTLVTRLRHRGRHIPCRRLAAERGNAGKQDHCRDGAKGGWVWTVESANLVRQTP